MTDLIETDLIEMVRYADLERAACASVRENVECDREYLMRADPKLVAEVIGKLRAKVAEVELMRAELDALREQEPFGFFRATSFGWEDCAEEAEGAIALYKAPLPAAQSVPEGWQLVPKELDIGMLQTALDWSRYEHDQPIFEVCYEYDQAMSLWGRLLAAAPKPEGAR